MQFSVSLDNFSREEVTTCRSVLENDFKATMKLLRKQKFNRFEKLFSLMFQFYCKILFRGIEKTELQKTFATISINEVGKRCRSLSNKLVWIAVDLLFYGCQCDIMEENTINICLCGSLSVGESHS